MFIKSFAAIAAVSALGAGSAMAGPYVNVEANSGWVGDDYTATVTDLHVGYENGIGEDGSYYIQAGPAIVSVDGETADTEFSGKVGAGVDLSESLNLYGEVAFLSNGSDDYNYGTKVGVKYSF